MVVLDLQHPTVILTFTQIQSQITVSPHAHDIPATMPTPATASNHHTHLHRHLRHRPEDLIAALSSTDGKAKLKALRELKNQIIGNRTKKLSYIKLGAVPSIVSVLFSSTSSPAFSSDDGQGGGGDADSLLIQSVAAIGSFACGVDAGVKAVLDAGAFPHLMSLLSHPNEKVMDAGARSLRMIYQSKFAPKYEFLKGKNMDFLLSLFNSENENVTALGASIVSHSCETSIEQEALSDAGVLKMLIGLLEGSLILRDASLGSLATILRENVAVISKFVGLESGTALTAVTELTNDKYTRTRLLACVCMIAIRNTSPSFLQDVGIKTKLILVLLELLDDAGAVGDEAAFALSSFIANNEDIQKLAFEANVVDKLCQCLQKGSQQPKRFQGILIALADLCSTMESCRSKFISLKVAALGAISNIVIDFASNKSVFIECGGIKQLAELSKSMDATIRVNAVWALRNLTFLVDKWCKELILLELTASTLTSLICDPEPSVQEQALALVRNLVDGSLDSVEYIFAEDCLLLHAVVRQLQSALKAEVLIQGMYILSNVASGIEIHKEAVMQQLFPPEGKYSQSILVRFLQSGDSRLRAATVWALVNLTFPSCSGAFTRIVKLRNAGIVSQLKIMVHDPCLDVKLRAETALGQCMTFGDAFRD